MRYIFLILSFCFSASAIHAQHITSEQHYVIKRPRVFDNEKIFTEREIEHLDSIVTACWNKGIADIAIVTVGELTTETDNFAAYVTDNLLGYAQGEYGKHNGIVVALSKKMRQIHIQNGHGPHYILQDEELRRILNEQFLPRFKEGHYFEGVLNGTQAIIDQVSKRTS